MCESVYHQGPDQVQPYETHVKTYYKPSLKCPFLAGIRSLVSWAARKAHWPVYWDKRPGGGHQVCVHLGVSAIKTKRKITLLTILSWNRPQISECKIKWIILSVSLKSWSSPSLPQDFRWCAGDDWLHQMHLALLLNNTNRMMTKIVIAKTYMILWLILHSWHNETYGTWLNLVWCFTSFPDH